MKRVENFQIHQVAQHAGDCEICGQRAVCFYVDEDFRGASVCERCSGFVIVAEHILTGVGFLVPTDSSFDSMP